MTDETDMTRSPLRVISHMSPIGPIVFEAPDMPDRTITPTPHR
jgi:hypothetical protein